MKIKQVIAREILDSRGNPTLETKVILEDGLMGRAKVPSGASTGSHEALELRDNDKRRYGGLGVLKAVNNVNTKIAKALVGRSLGDIKEIDNRLIDLDGTPNKAKLGANAILSVSLATTRVAALANHLPLYRFIREAYGFSEKKFLLPIPTMNILNGGRHANNGLSIQEFMVIPQHKLFRERVRMGAQIFHTLAKLLKENNFSVAVGDEGGFAPALGSNERAMDFITQAIKKGGWKLGKEVSLGLDVAASEIYRDNQYFLNPKEGWLASRVINEYIKWSKDYALTLIEDGLGEDDWGNWRILTSKLGKKLNLVGDDLFVTDSRRLKQGIEEKVANTVLIKLNQIGTLTETMETIMVAKKNNYQINISHRSGETADTFIADLAVAVNSDFIKTGSLSRSERVEKYNRLMEIELELNS